MRDVTGTCAVLLEFLVRCLIVASATNNQLHFIISLLYVDQKRYLQSFIFAIDK